MYQSTFETGSDISRRFLDRSPNLGRTLLATFTAAPGVFLYRRKFSTGTVETSAIPHPNSNPSPHKHRTLSTYFHVLEIECLFRSFVSYLKAATKHGAPFRIAEGGLGPLPRLFEASTQEARRECSCSQAINCLLSLAPLTASAGYAQAF